jgi:hypothetical protein
MRRCLLNVQAMISHAEIDCRDTIIHALNGRKLKYAFISWSTKSGVLIFAKKIYLVLDVAHMYVATAHCKYGPTIII